MDDGAPGLEVGFAINTGGSYGELEQLVELMGSAEAKVVADAQKIERATGGMLNLRGASAQITTFGNATTREMQTVVRETARAEKAGEALSRQLDRQISSFGRSRAEVAAYAAQQAGLTELSERLLSQEAQLAAMHEQAAAAKRNEAAATARLAQEQAELVALVRGSHAAQMEEAEAAERMRMATDPLYAATKRLNAEIAESTRLYQAGATAPAEYARQQEFLSQRLKMTADQHDAMAIATRKSGFAMKNFALQMPDVAQGLLTGQKPLTIFIQQGGQIAQVAMMAEGGIKGFIGELGGLAVAFAPAIAVAAVAAAAFGLFARSVSQGIDTKEMIKGLGLTHAEIKRLKDTTVGMGDVMTATFQVLAENVGIHLGSVKKWFGDAMDFLTKAGRVTLAALYAQFVGTFRAIGAIVQGVWAGKSIREILGDVGDAYKGAFDQANGAMIKFGDDVNKKIKSNKLDELRKQAAAIKADRGPDRHAADLAREAAAMEAQINNLYKLAAAYGESGGAALIAEARVKAESEAIKKRGDIEEAVARQVRLAVAERVKNAAAGTASMTDEVKIVRQINREVAAGNVGAEQANELLAERMADLPLLAAMDAAQKIKSEALARKDIAAAQDAQTAYDAAAHALDGQRQSQEDLNAARREAWRLQAMAGGKDQLEMLREELRLIGATEQARVHDLAVLKATQEAAAHDLKGPKASEYVDQQTKIADATFQLSAAQRDYNDSLNHTAEIWDIIARNVQDAASGMADAFGDAGRSLGGIASAYADFRSSQEREKAAHKQAIQDAGSLDAALREMAKHQLITSTQQVGLYGDLASAAKGFFAEGSDGYKALQAAEQTFRAVQFALSVRAMAQDAIETAKKIANSGASAIADAVAAVAKAIASLPFPLNLVAGAATAAALASIGIAIAGSFGGGNNLPATNTGTGTVLGDSSAKSESIKNGLDALHQVDLLMLSTSRQMAASLKSIDNQINGFASVLVRNGADINASSGINLGFNNTTGKVVGAVSGGAIGAMAGSILGPIGTIVGGLLGSLFGDLIGSLFGTRKDVVGTGISGGPQSVGSIVNGGFNAQYYSDIQNTHKFLGIVTGRSYETQYGAADPAVANQFTLILQQFDKAILAAAGPLGEATSSVEQRLNSFVVNLGKIELKDLTGDQITEKLNAVFGAAADNMANAAFPGIQRFQKVGEGAFETLVRVASTLEQVNSTLGLLGNTAAGMTIDAKLGLVDQFDSITDLTNAAGSYFEAFYTKEEQAAARTAQMAKVFQSLGFAMPDTIAGFRQLVEAQNLNTQAGQSAYALLLQLAPAFADLKSSMEGAKSAADIASERQDLERQLLELRGDTAALRALELSKIDESNRALQEQVWALQDAQQAADAAKQLADAWKSVGDSITDEVSRIRGLNGAASGGNFASLLGQFNATNTAARGGDIDAAKSLPGLSQALLTAAAQVATSRQELARVQAQTAASLETTNTVVAAMQAAAGSSNAALLQASATTQAATSSSNDNTAQSYQASIDDLRAEIAGMRSDNNSGHANTASKVGGVKQVLDNVTLASGGDAIATVAVG